MYTDLFYMFGKKKKKKHGKHNQKMCTYTVKIIINFKCVFMLYIIAVLDCAKVFIFHVIG